MDSIDHTIVALMRRTRGVRSRTSASVSLSAPAVKRRVDRLQSEGVIKGYTTTVDHSAFGWNAHAFVELFCEGRMSATEVREAMAHSEVEAAYTVAGAASAILHLRAEDNQHLEDALERIRETDACCAPRPRSSSRPCSTAPSPRTASPPGNPRD